MGDIIGSGIITFEENKAPGPNVVLIKLGKIISYFNNTRLMCVLPKRV